MKTELRKKMIIELGSERGGRRRAPQTHSYCRECLAETDFVTAGEAARIVQTGAQTIFRLTEAGVLHSPPANGGELCVCLTSLELFEQNRFS